MLVERDGRTNQHVPLDLFKANVTEIIQMVWAQAPQADVLLITPPPLIDAMWQARPTATPETAANRIASHSRLYAEALLQVSADTGVPVLDLGEPYDAGEDAAAQSALFSDGLHFSEQGSALFAELFLATIAARFGISPEAVPMDLPPW